MTKCPEGRKKPLQLLPMGGSLGVVCPTMGVLGRREVPAFPGLLDSWTPGLTLHPDIQEENGDVESALCDCGICGVIADMQPAECKKKVLQEERGCPGAARDLLGNSNAARHIGPGRPWPLTTQYTGTPARPVNLPEHRRRDILRVTDAAEVPWGQSSPGRPYFERKCSHTQLGRSLSTKVQRRGWLSP